jgi:hypothetical protein
MNARVRVLASGVVRISWEENGARYMMEFPNRDAFIASAVEAGFSPEEIKARLED